MFYQRAEHVIHKFKGNIYVLGGMAYRNEQNGGRPFVQSLNTCEFFSIDKKKWIMLPNFEKPRQSFSVCQFNEKYIFILGGKCLKPEARMGDKLPFTFVEEVEAFDIERNIWKTINYITDACKLRILHAGVIQVTSKKILIFGGMVEPDQEQEGESDSQMMDNDQVVSLTSQTYLLDVTVGSIKRGAELVTPSYYINNGGSLLSIDNSLYALGFRVNPAETGPSAKVAAFSALAGEEGEKEAPSKSEEPKLQDAGNLISHKKILHCYDLTTQEFEEIHEGVFTPGTRKQSLDLDD